MRRVGGDWSQWGAILSPDVSGQRLTCVERALALVGESRGSDVDALHSLRRRREHGAGEPRRGDRIRAWSLGPRPRCLARRYRSLRLSVRLTLLLALFFLYIFLYSDHRLLLVPHCS